MLYMIKIHILEKNILLKVCDLKSVAVLDYRPH